MHVGYCLFQGNPCHPRPTLGKSHHGANPSNAFTLLPRPPRARRRARAHGEHERASVDHHTRRPRAIGRAWLRARALPACRELPGADTSKDAVRRGRLGCTRSYSSARRRLSASGLEQPEAAFVQPDVQAVKLPAHSARGTVKAVVMIVMSVGEPGRLHGVCGAGDRDSREQRYDECGASETGSDRRRGGEPPVGETETQRAPQVGEGVDGDKDPPGDEAPDVSDRKQGSASRGRRRGTPRRIRRARRWR